MAITTEVTKQFENGFVQLDTTYKNGYKRYYKIPQKNADIFAYKLKQHEKNTVIGSNIVFFASIIAGIAGASYFTKNMDNSIKKFLINTLSAMGFATISSFGFGKYSQNKELNLQKSYQAKEILYKNI